MGISLEKTILALENTTIFNISHVIYNENLLSYDNVILFEQSGVKVLTPMEYKEYCKRK